ncbi:MAG: thioredoxin [Holosporales bacterium]|jgi:thioredoxin 1|nr:thioredoxin [Holosporales bacterium]
MLDIVDEKEFESIMKDVSVLYFWATWCGPCRMLSSVIDEYTKDHPTVSIVKINVDESKEIAAEYDIQSLPTVLIFKRGKEIASRTGFMSKSAFADFIISSVNSGLVS